MSTRSAAIRWAMVLALARMRNGLNDPAIIGSHSAPKLRNLAASGPPSPETIARAPA
jgi:hypothetical protein